MPGRIRRIAAARLRHGGASEEIVDRVRLVVTELVTNAVQHADGERIDFALLLHSGLVVIAVDSGAAFTPTIRQAGPNEQNGRGLFLAGSCAA
ncbi:ATP-binding protein [Streptomyces sp. NPDC021093]|uniref:ATP-binding protein n=1 Tax=Streptomyces sp. NPDC021093 TaxID=3365112 RepID=UPI0037BA8EAB